MRVDDGESTRGYADDDALASSFAERDELQARGLLETTISDLHRNGLAMQHTYPTCTGWKVIQTHRM